MRRDRRELPFREDDVAATRDRLRDFLFKNGRPRAVVDYDGRDRSASPRHRALHDPRASSELKIGKVVIRGNFRTHASVIRGQLAQASRTSTRASRSPPTRSPRPRASCATRRCSTRSTSSCPISRRDSSTSSTRSSASRSATTTARRSSSAPATRATRRVRQRHARPTRNIGGRGISLTLLSARYGTKLTDYEATLRFPQWLLRAAVRSTPRSPGCYSSRTRRGSAC